MADSFGRDPMDDTAREVRVLRHELDVAERSLSSMEVPTYVVSVIFIYIYIYISEY